MPDLQIMAADSLDSVDDYVGPFAQLAARGGEVPSLLPGGFGQFRLYTDVEQGSVLQWQARQRDEGVYWARGETTVDGESIGPSSAVIVEADVPACMEGTSDARLVRVGTAELGLVSNFEGEPLKVGTTLAVPADQRYTFDTTKEWEFLNYHPDAPYVNCNPAEPPMLDQV
jgi:hypothetical protein